MLVVAWGTAFTLLRYQASLKVHCCDFSPRAVEFVKQNELYNAELITAHACDLVNEELPFPT
jgi:methyltransferase-like protein 6